MKLGIRYREPSYDDDTLLYLPELFSADEGGQSGPNYVLYDGYYEPTPYDGSQGITVSQFYARLDANDSRPDYVLPVTDYYVGGRTMFYMNAAGDGDLHRVAYADLNEAIIISKLIQDYYKQGVCPLLTDEAIEQYGCYENKHTGYQILYGKQGTGFVSGQEPYGTKLPADFLASGYDRLSSNIFSINSGVGVLRPGFLTFSATVTVSGEVPISKEALFCLTFHANCLDGTIMAYEPSPE